MIFILGSCNNIEKENAEFSNVATINLKINLNDTTEQYAQHVFDSIVYIPLETNKISSFGKIRKMEVTDNYFIIEDKTTNAILMFDKKGKFHAKITNSGKSPKLSYKNIGGFTVDRNKKQILIRDSYRNKIVFYDFQANKIKEEDYPFYFAEFCKTNNWSYFYERYSTDNFDITDNNNLLIINNSDKDKIPNSRYFHFDPSLIQRADIIYNDAVLYYGGKNDIFYVPPYRYRIYELKNSKIATQYKFILPKANLLPKNFLYSKEYSGRIKTKFILSHRNKNIAWTLQDVYRIDNLLTFKIRTTAMPYIFVYNLDSKSYLNVRNIYSDKINYLLPFIENNINASDREFLYTSISSRFMFDAISKVGTNTGIKNNPVLSSYFKEQSILSNPVIVKLKVKKHGLSL